MARTQRRTRNHLIKNNIRARKCRLCYGGPHLPASAAQQWLGSVPWSLGTDKDLICLVSLVFSSGISLLGLAYKARHSG